MARRNITTENILTRKVLVEKVSSNTILYCYTYPNFKEKKDMYVSSCLQWEESTVIAKQNNYAQKECSEIFLFENNIRLVGKELVRILVKALNGEIKHVFVSDIKLFCKNKILRLYIIQMLLLEDVTIHTKTGNTVDYKDCRGLPGFEDFPYFLEAINEVRLNHSQGVRN